MRILITGAAGFAGNYLIQYIKKHLLWDITAVIMESEDLAVNGVDIRTANILDKDGMLNIVREVQPDYVIHLAAQSSVRASWEDPAGTVDINIKGTVHLIEALRQAAPEARILLAGSAEEYGSSSLGQCPLREDTAVKPVNIYAVTKACQNMIGMIYSNAYHMNIIMARSFNHIGPGQSPVFVVSDFCRQAAEIEKGYKPPVIRTGNLDVYRDFMDVRDIVRIYTTLVQYGTGGETYNVGSGKAVSLNSILGLIVKNSPADIQILPDPDKMRPADIKVLEADITKLKQLTPSIVTYHLEETVRDILDYWRSKI